MENGILKRGMEDEPQKKEEEEADAPNEDKAIGMMKEELMVKIADIISAILMPDLKNLEKRLESIENT
eukprot:7194311-Heterocapsa_arctica.AAC.1